MLTKNIPGKLQKDLLERGLPFGIYCEKFIKEDTNSEHRTSQWAYHELIKKQLFSRVPLGNKGTLKRINRDILNRCGIQTVLQHIVPPELTTYIPPDITVTLKGTNYNQDKFLRLARHSDAQEFLVSCKVDTPYTVLTQHHYDPFIFGTPPLDISDADKISLSDMLIYCMSQYVRTHRMPSVIDTGSISCIYYSNYYNTPTKYVDINSSNVTRTFNNSVGTLVDFHHDNAYMVFKFTQPKDFYWATRAYNTALVRIQRGLDLAGISNIDPYTKHINAALILCETDTVLKHTVEKGSDCIDGNASFSYVLPVRMNEAGHLEIDALLTMGLDAYIASYDKEMTDAFQETLQKRNTFFVSAHKGSVNRYFNGFYINISAINRIKKEQLTKSDDEQTSFIICKPEQVDLYTNTAGIDKSHLIVI